MPTSAGSGGTASIASRRSRNCSGEASRSVVNVCSTLGASATAAAAMPAEWASVTRNLASLLLRMNASLPAFVCGLMNVNAPPATSTPKMAAAHSTVLSR